MMALGLEIPTSQQVAPKAGAAAPAPVQQAPAPNLLDFGNEPSVPPQAPPPAPPSEILPPAAIDTGNSLFGGMTVKGTAPPLAAPAPAPAVVEPDFLGTIVAEPALVPATSSTAPADLFGDVAIKPSPSENENDANIAQNSASDNKSSAFSFLSSTTSLEEEDTKVTESAPKPIFDPLMGLSGASATTQQPSMPPQMAVMYQQQQQQLLMMQAQMQQMQMAAAAAGNTAAPFMMPPLQQNSNPNLNMPINVMGATGGSGAKTSFAFMEDPSQKRKEATNKKFDFVQDAMKGAK
jgi:hypothetical protein